LLNSKIYIPSLKTDLALTFVERQLFWQKILVQRGTCHLELKGIVKNRALSDKQRKFSIEKNIYLAQYASKRRDKVGIAVPSFTSSASTLEWVNNHTIFFGFVKL
jgi:hypothetical protein